MGLGHLVEDVDALARLRRSGDGKLDAAARILDVDESARLPAGSMHRQRIIERRLHDEAIEDGAVIAVIIETVDQPLIELGLFGLRAPDDPLMKIGNADANRRDQDRKSTRLNSSH